MAPASSRALSTIQPPSAVPMPECMSQSPWSTVTTSTPTLPRITRATCGQRLAEVASSGSSPCCRRPPCAGPNSSTAAYVDRIAAAERRPVVVPQRVQRRRAGRGRPLVVAGEPDLVDARRPTSSGCVPYSDVGRTPPPRLKPWSGERPASVPISRLSQPLRALEPGSASSTASIAAKWERLGAGSPVAWTAARRARRSRTAAAARARGAGRTCRRAPAAGRRARRCSGGPE